MKKIYLGLVMLLAAASTFAFDQDYVTLTTYSAYDGEEFSNEVNLTDMKAGDLAYVVCTLENKSDSTYHAFEFEIALPEGFVLEPIYDEDEEEYFTSKALNELSRSNHWTYKDTYNEAKNTFKVVLFTLNPDKYEFPATTGKYAGPELFYFSIKATDSSRNDFAPISATGIIFSKSIDTGEKDSEGKPILTTEDHFFPNIYNLYYKVSDYKYNTLCYNGSLDFTGSSLKANVAKDGGDGYVDLTPVEIVPAGAPIVITGEPGSYMLNAKYGKVEADAAFEGNELKGTPDGSFKVEDNKIFAMAYKQGKGVGFYRCDNGVVIPRYKAYLESEANADAFLFEETTGISNVEATADNAEVYTISGVKVEKAAQKGIYIVNGKKVVVK